MNKNKVKRTLALLCAAMVVVASGCGSKTSETAKIEGNTPDTYPIETDATVTYWMALDAMVSSSYKNFGETPYAQKLQEDTGIKIEYIHPPAGQDKERLNLLIASDDMPDITEFLWRNYSGSLDKLIEDNVILDLSEAIDKVSPNLKKILETDKEVKDGIQTNNGHYYIYPMFREDTKMTTFAGYMIRQDLLEEIGEDMPETIDDWDRILYKFKDMGLEMPLYIPMNYFKGNYNALASAFNCPSSFYIDGDTIKYGPYEKGFEPMVEKLAQWYSDGIITEQLFLADSNVINNLVTNGEVGIVMGSCGSNFGGWIPALSKNLPEANFQPIKYPVAKEGERAQFAQSGNRVGGYGAAISAKSKVAELCARLLDYNYSEAGDALINYGIEGISYEMVDGVAKYTENILDRDKNGNVSIGEALAKYSRACYTAPMQQRMNYITQYYVLEQQQEALDVWTDNDAAEHVLPVFGMTDEERDEYARIMADVETYFMEKFSLFVKGDLGASDIDAYFDGMKQLGIERAIQIQQQAYERKYK